MLIWLLYNSISRYYYYYYYFICYLYIPTEDIFHRSHPLQLLVGLGSIDSAVSAGCCIWHNRGYNSQLFKASVWAGATSKQLKPWVSDTQLYFPTPYIQPSATLYKYTVAHLHFPHTLVHSGYASGYFCHCSYDGLSVNHSL